MARDPFKRRRRPLPQVLLYVLLATACDSVRSPGSPSPRPTPEPSPELLPYRVSGIVTDAAGAAPISGATVMLRHALGNATARTDENGAYAFSFYRGQPYRAPLVSVPENVLGLLIVGNGAFWGDIKGGHWTNVQMLPWQMTDVVQNVRLRPVRTLQAGQSLSLSVEPDSSLVWDYEWDPWDFPSFDRVWEEFLVSVPTDGALTVDVRPPAGGIPGTLTCRYVGCPSWHVESTVSIHVEARWSPFYFSVEIPRARAPQQYEIQTSFR
jgi:hypothetical protein